MKIRSYQSGDESSVIELWRECGLVAPQNDPHRDVQRKLKVNPEWFLVGEKDGTIVASCMAGYEGHRGWINYLAVAPSEQRNGYARQMMEEAERLLRLAGCPKINLQVRASNNRVIEFYQSIGFKVDDVVSLGKRLEVDSPDGRVPIAGAGFPSFVSEETPRIIWRQASDSDICLLAAWNQQLIRDEGHRNTMNIAQLEDRMKHWLKEMYRAVIFSTDEPFGYALFREEKERIHLRQFFVRRDRRRQGLGRAALSILKKDVWPAGSRLTVDVLCQNSAGIAFWRSAGYQGYCLTLEIVPG